MAGTKEGGRKASQTNKKKYGKDFYSRIAARSWSDPNRSRETGFALDPARAAEAGRKGGKKTKKEYKTNGQKETQEAYYTPEEFSRIIKKDDTDSL